MLIPAGVLDTVLLQIILTLAGCVVSDRSAVDLDVSMPWPDAWHHLVITSCKKLQENLY